MSSPALAESYTDAFALARTHVRSRGSAAACPLCGHAMRRLYAAHRATKERLPLFLCTGCHSIFRLKQVAIMDLNEAPDRHA